MVWVKSKDVGEVKDKYIAIDFQWGIEDGIEQWIKKELRCEG